MIGRIQGQLLEISDNFMLIDVGGLAYEVEVTTEALATAGGTGADIALFTHLVVREDAQLLYGFGSRTERDVFRDLISISGVGPKLGLAIVSGLSLEALVEAVRAGDPAMLTRVQGVGRKTAERLLVELKDRLGNLHIVVKPTARSVDQLAVREAEDALVALGYRPAEAERTVAAVAAGMAGVAELEGAQTSELLLRAALQQIARQAEASA